MLKRWVQVRVLPPQPMVDSTPAVPRPITYCRVCSKLTQKGEEGGAKVFALCGVCASKYWPDLLPEIQEKCPHDDVAEAGLEHDPGVYHRKIMRCTVCLVEDAGDWEFCTCPKVETIP